MDLHDSPEEAAFRLELREWLENNVPAGDGAAEDDRPSTVTERFAQHHAWHAALHSGGWLGLDWPAEFGGRALSPIHQLILNEELDAVDAPPIANWVGLELVGPSLLRWGSEEQKRRWLPGILDGTNVWCQGFSEPGAGSDLAAVTTTATKTDGGWVLDGHKRWTSWAQFSDHVLVLARTGPVEARHRALSCFVVPMDATGLRVEPIPMLYGDAEESDLSLSGVHVPDDALVGDVDRGWGVVMTSLTLARGPATLARISTLQASFRALAATVMDGMPAVARSDGDHRQLSELTEIYAELEALRFLAYRKMGELEETGAPGQIASTEKLLWAQLNAKVGRLTVEWAGFKAIASPLGALAPRAQREFYRALAGEIEGGTNEIQRTVIARHVLGLPC
jgi:alkylation response protein AidB-like acyl-CoA dehydrogenase